MKTILLSCIITIVLCSCHSRASSFFEKVDTTTIAKIKEEALHRSLATQTLRELSDIYGSRLTWSPEYRKAAEWTTTKLHEWGIPKTFYENWGPTGKSWSMKRFSLQVLEPAAYTLTAIPKPWSPFTGHITTSNLVYLDAATEADFAKYSGKLKEAIVLIAGPKQLRISSRPEVNRYHDTVLAKLAAVELPTEAERVQMKKDEEAGSERFTTMMRETARKIAFCKKEGALAVFEPGYLSYGTVSSFGALSPDEPIDWMNAACSASNPLSAETLPQIVIAAEQYNRLLRTVQKGVPCRIDLDFEAQLSATDSGLNIIGEIPGTDLKNEVVVIGAHFDTYPAGGGATDNTSSVVVCMEAMRILKKLGIRPRRTIRIGLWGGEEQGLLGAKAHVAKHFGLKSDETCSLYLNLDNGAGRIRGIYMQENRAAQPIFKDWFSALKDPKAQTVSLANTTHTDHIAFDEAGLPGFQFIQDLLDYFRIYHTNMDLPDRVPEEDIKVNSFIFAAFAYNAAMRDGLIPRKTVQMPRSE